MEYIEREAALRKIKKLQEADPAAIGKKQFADGFFCGLDEAEIIIRQVPAADVAPVVRGRLGVSYMDEYYGDWANCLECGTDNILPCHYCRWCGAKMDAGIDNAHREN